MIGRWSLPWPRPSRIDRTPTPGDTRTWSSRIRGGSGRRFRGQVAAHPRPRSSWASAIPSERSLRKLGWWRVALKSPATTSAPRSPWISSRPRGAGRSAGGAGRAAGGDPTPSSRAHTRRVARPPRRRCAGLAAVALVGALVTGGVAVAATGNLPAPVRNVARSILGGAGGDLGEATPTRLDPQAAPDASSLASAGTAAGPKGPLANPVCGFR
jgi:hypothetical protein